MRHLPAVMPGGIVPATLIIGWLAAACARPAPPVPETDAGPSRNAAAADRSVSLERGPCFGTCPVYLVTVDGAGNVRFEGRRFVADTGISTGTVPRARLDSLFAEVDASGYFTLADRYGAGEPGCERYATDLPTITTEVRLGDRVKRVEHDRGCADVPEMLSALETRIDAVADVGRWIGR
ncbi:MAG: DUF6438 domain-containing protein [Gemmatimonadales bacterium]